jgi:protein-tyrosine phosphatase
VEAIVLEYSEIIPGRLWIGAYVCEDEVPELKQIGITTVFNMQTDEDLRHYGISPDGLARAYSSAGIEFQRQPTPDFDREALARNLPEAVARIETALADPGIRLYLHCTAGAIRSATTAAGYLIRSRGISAYEACAFLTSRRNCNPTLDILESYEIALSSASHE